MKQFVARNVAEVGRDSTAAIGVDTRCNSTIASNILRNIAPCIRTTLIIDNPAIPFNCHHAHEH